jgi:hypothetical protein
MLHFTFYSSCINLAAHTVTGLPTDKLHKAEAFDELTRRVSCLATLCSSSRTLARLSCSSTCSTARHSTAQEAPKDTTCSRRHVCVRGSSAHSLTAGKRAAGATLG